jgi:hypothetical protein
MEPEQYAALISEDICQNNGFLIELTVRELLLLEGLKATEATAIKHIKGLIKRTYNKVGAIRRPEDVDNIVNHLRDKFDILDLTDNEIIEEIISIIKIRHGGKAPNYAGDPGKVSKYIVGRGEAEQRAHRAEQERLRDYRLDVG